MRLQEAHPGNSFTQRRGVHLPFVNGEMRSPPLGLAGVGHSRRRRRGFEDSADCWLRVTRTGSSQSTTINILYCVPKRKKSHGEEEGAQLATRNMEQPLQVQVKFEGTGHMRDLHICIGQVGRTRRCLVSRGVLLTLYCPCIPLIRLRRVLSLLDHTKGVCTCTVRPRSVLFSRAF